MRNSCIDIIAFAHCSATENDAQLTRVSSTEIKRHHSDKPHITSYYLLNVHWHNSTKVGPDSQSYKME